MPKTGKVRVLNVTTVVEPGIVVNPRQLQRNAEGGAVMGVSEALHEQVVFNKSKITSTDWVTFPILRMRRRCRTSTSIVMNNPSVGAYGGAGEGPNGFVRRRSPTPSSTPRGSSRAGSRWSRSTSSRPARR